MADKNILEQMLGHLVNDDKQKAEELFHEYVVSKSREIYESLIEAEMDDEEEKEEDPNDPEVKEESEVDEENDLEENFEDVAFEGDDEMGGDPTDDLAGELDSEMGPEEEGGDDLSAESEEELFQDLDSIVDELQARFDALGGGDMGSDDMGGEEEMKDEFDLATVREYVEKVPAGHGAEKKGQAEKADGGTKSVIDNMKNDMGGTTANILSGRNGSEGSTTGALKGNGLLKGNPKEDNAGNINVPGGKAGSAFTTKEPGHGAEKKGAAEGSTDGQSLFRGRR